MKTGRENPVPTGTESRINRPCTVSAKKTGTGKKWEISAVTGTETGEGISRPFSRLPYYIQEFPAVVPVFSFHTKFSPAVSRPPRNSLSARPNRQQDPFQNTNPNRVLHHHQATPTGHHSLPGRRPHARTPPHHTPQSSASASHPSRRPPLARRPRTPARPHPAVLPPSPPPPPPIPAAGHTGDPTEVPASASLASRRYASASAVRARCPCVPEWPSPRRPDPAGHGIDGRRRTRLKEATDRRCFCFSCWFVGIPAPAHPRAAIAIGGAYHQSCCSYLDSDIR